MNDVLYPWDEQSDNQSLSTEQEVNTDGSDD